MRDEQRRRERREPRSRGLPNRTSSNTDFAEVAWSHPANNRLDIFSSQLNAWPRSGEQYQDRQFPSGEILLVPKTLVRGDQKCVTVVLCSIEQHAVAQIRPSALEGGVDQCSARC